MVDECCGGRCKTQGIHLFDALLDVKPAEDKLVKSIASEIEQEDPDGRDEIIELYSEDL
jgi:hypothetical protein